MPRSRPLPDRELADRLHSAAIHLLRRLRRTDPLTGVSASQLSALSVLMGGPRTLGELASAEQVRPPTMTRVVQDLEAAGLVRRGADARDARLVRVSPTAKGQRVLARGRELRIRSLESRVRGLGQADRVALARALPIIERLTRSEGSEADGR
ncbi:MAG TPA: MarR family transcriptional regulator [Candidatus Limnocylindrales bacterium]|nr:MarR family transcriptional regulator [Candidatus Limnocylindrales bacterium]